MSSVTLESSHGAAAVPIDRPIARRTSVWRFVIFSAITVLATLPVADVLGHWLSTTRNIAYWDEIDTALPFLVHLQAGVNPERFVADLFAVTNEHRTVTSRLLFALSYWCTGTVDFVWIGAIGNTFIVLACGALIWAVRTTERRLQLGVVLGYMIFHLGNYESFLWSGSSIDHFQVIALAVAALLAVQRDTVAAFRVAVLAAGLASFTLAHGLVAWPIGFVVLLERRRWKALGWWTLAASIVGWIFLSGFYWNAGHSIGTHGTAMIRIIASYWLEILGAPLAFGHATLAIAVGAALVGAAIARTVLARSIVASPLLPVLWFLLGAAALIAFGRAEFTHGHVFSRYFIVGAMAWSILIFDALEGIGGERRRLLVLAGITPFLVGFNLAQNVHYRGDAATFVENRDRAALRYGQFGEDGHAPLTLHPDPRHATELLATASRSGVYHMPPVCTESEFPGAKPTDAMSYFVDELTLNGRSIYVAGWAALKDEPMQRGAVHVILQSPDRTFVFTTVGCRRADVADAYHDSRWEWSGFRFELERDRLPAAEYRIGFLIDGDEPQFVMTAHRLDLRGAGKRFLAGVD